MSPTVRFVAAAALALAASAAQAVECDFEIDGDTRVDRDGDLVFERAGNEVVRITETPTLLIDGALVETTAEQQAELIRYRGIYDTLVDEAKEIGLAGAKLGGKAAYAMVVGLLTGTADKAEANIEAEAAALEAQAEVLCDVVHELRASHEALSAAIPAFATALPVR